MKDSHPTTLEGSETPPQFERVADVLGPLEQVVLAADQKLGSIQQTVTTQAGHASAEVERRVRESAVEQRRRLAELRQGLTGRKSELSARFDAILNLLDEVDHELALRAGERTADVPATMTEPQTAEAPRAQAAAPGPAAAEVPPAQAASEVAAARASESGKEKGVFRWFRRSKRSSA
ncbi:MAG: hypothetical protein ACRDKV_10155 [Solirubrobacterales bacterium]